ncbi:hypothetical protein BOTBODRAFT_64891, partial [Botryobasidium botryosum FD-172 SS1]
MRRSGPSFAPRTLELQNTAMLARESTSGRIRTKENAYRNHPLPPLPSVSANTPRDAKHAQAKRAPSTRRHADPHHHHHPPPPMPEPRTRIARSNTAHGPPQVVPTTRPPNRSHSSDSIDRKTPASSVARGKKNSHVDLIDKLDITGGLRFHHDGPFDACAPSRNRTAHQAPMLAFNDHIEEVATKPNVPSSAVRAAAGYPPVDRRLSSRAQAAMAAARDGPYGAAAGYYASSGSKKPKSPKEDVLAAAWGRADPEPFEEFSAGTGTGSTTSSIYGSYDFAGKDARAPPAAAPRRGRPSIPPPLPLDLPGSPTA